MPPKPHSDVTRPRAQARAAIGPSILLLALAACDPSPPPPDAGRADAGEPPDGGPSPFVDGGQDAGTRDGGGVTLPRTCVSPEGADPAGTDAWSDPLGRASVTIDERGACRRTYTLATTAALRDGEPDNPRTVVEREGWPTARTGHDLFDALYALALEETRELGVSAIRDYAFDEGRAVDCGGCFETGRLWNYVWTRDTAYAVHLGMASVDPTRSRRSLEFKLSERRGGGDLQVVQDTGTGGSYPVSSDRVSWAIGASELLHHLHGAEREAFAARTLEALSNTLEHDRRIVYDATDGLYLGEQSFLDWREQTYPEWTATDVVHIGMSKALGTNLLHLNAMEVASALAAEAGDTARRDRYGGWAEALRAAIRDRLWLEDEGNFSTYVTTGLDPAPVRRFDLLGSSLAILLGVASPAQSQRILSSYPHYGPGAPVAWPQQQDVRIYHNRGEWPFVTAYWLRAAKAANHPAVADRMVRALIRGAAINLSNMENFDAGTGAAWHDDGPASGPVVNSQRQLWSVAAYLSMVHHTIFGLEAEADGLHVRPYVTGRMRRELFAGTSTLVLNDYRFRGHTVTVVLHLPADAGEGALQVRSIALDGRALSGDLLAGLEAGANRVDVELGPGTGDASRLTEASAATWREVFGPRTPRITGIRASGGRIVLDLSTSEAADVTWRIYRDGEVVADGLAGATTSWTDPTHDATSPRSPCYTAELTFTASGTHSQHAPPVCWWGPGAARVRSIDASAMAHVGGSPSTSHGRFHYEGWGDDGHSLTVSSFTATQSGPHLLQLVYGNGAGAISTGITCSVKRIVVEEIATGRVVAQGPVIMPHLGDWSRWADSSLVRAELTAGTEYRVVIRGDDEVVNMSAFAHFERYTGGLGGASGTFFRANVAALKILAR
ncbi:MAG: hypothetical protein KF729_36615 [Sandaracinaceae bacterium]|nr:hypothetical protein [Sandaracinaceae bacterium]